MKFGPLLRAFLKARLLPYSLTVLLMTLGVATILLLLHSEQTLKQQFAKNLGVDLVVGAKGSPLQLVLSSLYHVDIPTGNISIAEAEKLCQHPDIKACVPLALGDNYQGFPIVGTNVAVRDWGLGLPAATVAELGPNYHLKPLQALIGQNVAQKTGLQTGGQFAGSHGLVGDGHDELPYTVVGILPTTDKLIDRLIVTPVESVHQIHAPQEQVDDHADHEEHDHGHHEDHDHAMEEHEADHHEPNNFAAKNHAEAEITALLIKVRNRRAVIGLPRWINANTPLMAAHPATEITRLYALLGGGLDSLRLLSMAVITAALLSLFIVLYTSLSARLPDLAMLRVLGWSRQKLAALMLAEGMSIAITGMLLGILVAVVVFPWFMTILGLPVATETATSILNNLFGGTVLRLLTSVLCLCLLACLLPVWRVYRLAIPSTLA